MSIARAIGDATRVAHRARRTAAPYKILAPPDENLVGDVRDNKCQPWRRAVTPRHQQKQRRQVYHRSDPPGHRATRNRRRAGLAIAYSLLLDGGRAVRARRFLLAAETCRPPARPRSRRGPDRCRTWFMQHNAAYRWRRCSGSPALHMQQNAAHLRGRGHPRPRDEDRSGPCGCAHAARGQAMGLCADTHTPDPSRGARSRQIRFACVLGPITP